MKPSAERTALSAVVALMGLAAVGAGLALRWPAGKPFPPLFYTAGSSGVASAVLVIAGVLGLATAWQVKDGARTGWLLLLAGLAWDAACQLAGLAGGHSGALVSLVVDLGVAGYVFARRGLFES